jgi:hypothetical protein
MAEPDARGSSEDEAAHDILAAEAFAVPGPDPDLSHRPVTLPEDPSGISEPHDILAAEEFAMPAARASRPTGIAAVAHPHWWVKVGGGIAGLLVAIGVRRRASRS